MLNLLPKYILISKVFLHLSLRTHFIWRISFVRERIGRKIQRIRAEQLTKQMKVITGEFGRQLFSDDKENSIIIASANRVLYHEFDILGSGWIKVSPMQWNKDLKTGYEWKNGVYYNKQLVQQGSKGSDVKFPWELSRCHHLLWLAEAYIITGKKEYAEAVVNDIEDWIVKNPFLYSINWTCSMDVAIRAVNWIFALSMISGSNAITDEFAAIVYKSLYKHGYYIYHHLEKSFPYSNNHYASNLAGLLYLGFLFKEDTKSKWFDFSIIEYCQEVRNQVLPSGIHYEKSVSYHRLMTELFGYPLYFLKREGLSIPADISYRIKTMFEYVNQYTKPNGCAPLVGDNDDGRFLPFVYRDYRVHNYLVNDSLELRIVSGERNPNIVTKPLCSRYYDDAGVVIIRQPEVYLFIKCSDRDKYSELTNKKRIGSHLHSDLMSFELTVGNRDIIIDPGTYIYTSDISQRNEFRSTTKHNVAFIDGEEQNILFKDDAFEIEYNTDIKSVVLKDNKNDLLCEGSYSFKKSGAFHSRRFVLTDGHLIIEDNIKKDGPNHNVILSLHLGEGIAPILDEGRVLFKDESYQFEVCFETKCPQTLLVEEDSYSPSYGVSCLSKTIRNECVFDNAIRIITDIVWKRNLR